MVSLPVLITSRSFMSIEWHNCDPNTISRLERGWAGHFICANRCLFRRNTLLCRGKLKVVVSTVGLLFLNENDKEPTPIGFKRHYETMVFEADKSQYNDADVTKPITFDSPWALELPADDLAANAMHEDVVDEIALDMINDRVHYVAA